jgi:hypothetical protein
MRHPNFKMAVYKNGKTQIVQRATKDIEFACEQEK